MMKQVIVVRKDLNMTRGKEVAQGAHASMGAILQRRISSKLLNWFNNTFKRNLIVIDADEQMAEWLNKAFTKVCVSCSDEVELLRLHTTAVDMGLNCSLIKDNGATMFKGVPTYTAIAIGPNEAKLVDSVTRHLKLR